MPRGGFLIFCEPFLHAREQLFRNKCRDSIWYHSVAEFIFSDIAAVGEHTLNNIYRHFSAAYGKNILCVQIIDNLFDRLSVGILREDFFDDRRGRGIRVEVHIFVYFIAERNLSAVVFSL